MKYFVLTLAIFLTSCATTTVPQYTMPTPPSELMVPPQALQPVKKSGQIIMPTQPKENK